jgi:ribokinase
VLNLGPAAAPPAGALDAVDVLVVNEIEVGMAAGDPGGDPTALARGLAARHGLTCVVTLGSAGAIAVSPEGGWAVPSLPVALVDTTGAGDCFTGVLAALLDEEMALPEALRRACVAASLACLEMGAQSSQPRRAAIEARLVELGPARRF